MWVKAVVAVRHDGRGSGDEGQAAVKRDKYNADGKGNICCLFERNWKVEGLAIGGMIRIILPHNTNDNNTASELWDLPLFHRIPQWVLLSTRNSYLGRNGQFRFSSIGSDDIRNNQKVLKFCQAITGIAQNAKKRSNRDAPSYWQVEREVKERASQSLIELINDWNTTTIVSKIVNQFKLSKGSLTVRSICN